ncbi:KxYKxGKxW signal peptide domain-containing protein [Lacticaseibacillus paracasei]
MSKNNSAKQFINENGKVRFRLYKSGKKWLIAGTATVSGLLGGMFIMPHGVQAASQPQIGKVIDKGEVLATKGSATIPASSTQASTATSESASTTDLNSASQSTSTSTSTATSTSTSQLNSTSQSSSTSQSTSTSGENSSSTSTNKSQSVQVADQTEANNQTTTVGKALAAVTNNHSLKNAAAVTANPDSWQYKSGLSDAKNRMDADYHFFYNGIGADLQINVLNLQGPGRAVKELGQLYDYYLATNGTMLDANGYSQAYSFFGLSTSNTDYAAGFAAYSAAYMKGIVGWLDSVKAKANDEANVNSIIDYKPYDASALSGGNFGNNVSAFFRFVSNWIFGAGTFAPNVLNAYTPDASNIAASEIKSTINNANNIIGFIATQVINGIAHMALSDVRSLGGADVAMNTNPATQNPISDYVPNTLQQAVALNGGNFNMIKLFGLSNVITSKFVNLIYDGIAEVARHAIQYNFFNGVKRALQNTLNGTTDDGSAFYSGKGVVGYSVTNPGQMADDDQTINLSMVSEANGYAWAYKVLVPLIKMASDNALKDAENGNTNQANLPAFYLVNQLITANALAGDQGAQIVNNAPHAFPQAKGEAANDRPPAPAATPVSPLGQGWWFLVFTNGLMTQPSDQNIVATNGSSMTVAVPLVTTNANGIFGIGNQRLSSVGYQQYNNSNGWPNRFTDVGSGNLSVGSNQPSTNATAKLSVPTTSGTYYYQLKLTYNNGSPKTVYSDVFAITVVPKPIDATGLVVTANQKSVLWGQQIGLNAQPMPTNSTATIGWR